ncbi:unnamed protein product [Sphagnum balticum]
MVDVLLSVSPISLALEGVTLIGKSSAGGSQLEGPEEVVGLLEVGSHRVDLVDEVLSSANSVIPEGLRNDGVVGEGDALSVDLSVSSLVDELADVFAGRVAVGDVGLNPPKEVDGGLVDAHEDTVVELAESEQTENADNLGVELDDTPNPDHECESRLGWDMDGACGFGLRK